MKKYKGIGKREYGIVPHYSVVSIIILGYQVIRLLGFRSGAAKGGGFYQPTLRCRD